MPNNDVDQWAQAGAQALKQSQAEQVRNSVQQAVGTNPDAEAGYQHLARFVGVPVDTVRDDPEGARQQAAQKQMDADKLVQDHPRTAALMTDADKAKIMHDDVPGTAGVEQAARALLAPAPSKPIWEVLGDNLASLVSAPGHGSAPAALLQGLAGSYSKAAAAVNVVAGAAPTLYDRAANLIRSKPNTDASDWWFKNMVEPRVNAAPAYELGKDATFTEKAFNTTGNLIGMLSQIVLTGGGGEAAAVTDAMPVAKVLGERAAHGVKSMAFPALADAVDTGRRVLEQTGDGRAAAMAAQMQYATSTMAGVVPLSAPGSAAVRAATGFVSGTALGETSRDLMNLVLPQQMQTPFDAEQLILGGLAGSIMGRAMGPRAEPAYHNAIRQTYVEAAKIDAANANGEALHALGQISAASKLRERDPAAFNEFVQSITDDGHLDEVFIGAKELTNALNQAGVTSEALTAKLPEVAAQLHEALQTSGDVRIPVADYATHIAGGPLDEAILPHLRADPEGHTYGEAKTLYQGQVESLKAAVDKIVADHTQGEEVRAGRDALRDKILGQLNTVNRFTPEVNRQYADMHADYYTVMAERAGMTPEQFASTYKLDVGAQSVTGDSVMNQGDQRELVVQHNLTAANLLHAHKQGGMAVPSLAITKASNPLHGFGEISLLGGKEMIDPKTAGNKVFGADIYSPRYPSVGHKVGTPELKSINAAIKPFKEFGGSDIYASEIGNDAVSGLLERNAVKAAALADMGVEVKPVLVDGKLDEWKTTMALRNAIHEHDAYSKVEAFARKLLADAGAQERIFTGYSRTGNQTFVPHTLENVIKILQKELRGGENFNYGVGTVRSKFTPQFKSIDQIIKNKDKLVDSAAFEKVKAEIGEEFDATIEALKPFHSASDKFGFSDTVSMMMSDSAKSGVPRALEMNGFKDVPVEMQKKVAEFLTKLRELPTEYFEAKALRAVPLSEFKTAVVPEGTDQKVLDALAKSGVTDIRTYKKGDEADRAAQIQTADHLLFQKARGQLAFGDDITRQASVMSLLKGADLSTFVHESGHFFLEVQADLAHKIEARIAAGEEVSAGERGILTDMHTILDWLEVKGTPEVSSTDAWGMRSLEEKRDQHETFARGFEAYAMEGKAPSVGLAKAFAAFRSWLLHVYKSMTDLKVELTPEVRGVFDRMLATDEAIKTAEQVRGFRPLFESAADAGMTPEDFAAYQELGKDATEAATTELDRRSLADMRWAANAKGKAMKALQKEAAGKRREVREAVTKEVMAQPIYQAWQFLTLRGSADTRATRVAEDRADPKYVDATRDNLFTAIAKHGGLNRDELKTKWGVDHKDMPDSGVFGKPVLRKSGGLSIERMAEKLHEDHYLDAHDLAEFEGKFDNQRGGHDQFSWEYDYSRGERAPAEPITDSAYHGKLDTTELKRMFGDDPDVVRKLTEKRMTSAKTGLDPDIVAEMTGAGTGREMIEQLLEAQTPHQVIEGMTDQRMLEQHGDLADARGIERAAEAAIHNDVRARFVASELRALAAASDVRADNGTNRKGHRMTVSALAAAAKEAADAAIAAKRVRDIRPAQYTAAEARAAKMAESALKSGDLKAAAVEKRAQLLNNRLVKAALDAVEEVRKGVQYLGKFDKASVRANIDLEYREQIDALLDRHDLRKSTTNTALDKRTSLLAFVENMAAQGYEPQIPERLLNEAARTHVKEMTVEEFRGLVDAIKSIEHLGRLKTRLLDLKETRELQELADEAVATTGTLPQRAAESNRGLTRMESKWLGVKSAGRSMQAALLKMEQMFDWLDARNPNGVFNRVVFRRIADAGTHENEMQATVKAGIDQLLHSHLADVTKNGDKIYTAPGLIDGLTGKAQRFTKKEMLALAGNMGNDSNMAKLLKGEKWDEAAVWDFLHQNMGKADWDFVAGLGRALETLWPEKLAMSRRLGNTNPDKIAPRAFDTPHGRYDGWYWPMVYDPARAQDVAERGAKAGDALFENIYSKANTDTGRMNTRNENYAKPLLLSLDVIPRVIKDEIHDIAYREAIIDADKFLAHKDVREAIQNALSPEHYDQLRPWLQSIANDRKVDMAALKWFDQLAHGARTRATIVGLGYRVSTMLVHGSSAAMESVAELGPVWMAKGLADFANPLQWSANKAFIFERSGEMRNRMNEVDRDVREHLREIEIRLMDTTTGTAARGADMMKAYAYHGIAMLDMASALPTWMGAYHRGMASEANGGYGMSEADAVYFADKTVRNAHGGTGVKDLAEVQRGSEFFKLFSMFYTFWNHNVNRLMDTARLAKSLPETYRNGAPGEFKGDLGLVIMRTLIYTLGVQAMHGMLHPKKDEDGETSWAGWAAKEFTAAAFAGIPFLRDVSAHFLTGKDYSTTPAAGLVGAIGNTGQDAMNMMAGREANPKWLKHSVTTAGYVFGLPLGQPASTAQFLWDIEQGKQHPETAGDWMRGVMTGEAKHH